MSSVNSNCFARCPFCNEQLEFTLDIQAMLSSEVTEPVEAGETSEEIHTLDVDGYHLRFRVPIGADLVEAGQIADRQAGRNLLLERCVIQALKDERVIAVIDLPEDILQELTETIVEHDPLAEMKFALN